MAEAVESGLTQPEVDEFEIMRRRVRDQGQRRREVAQRAAKQQFARLGNLPSGAAIKAESQAIGQAEQTTSQALQDVNILQAQQRRQAEEAKAQRGLQKTIAELQTGSAEKIAGIQTGSAETIAGLRTGSAERIAKTQTESAEKIAGDALEQSKYEFENTSFVTVPGPDGKPQRMSVADFNAQMAKDAFEADTFITVEDENGDPVQKTVKQAMFDFDLKRFDEDTRRFDVTNFIEQQVLDANGNPVLGSDGQPIFRKKSIAQAAQDMGVKELDLKQAIHNESVRQFNETNFIPVTDANGQPVLDANGQPAMQSLAAFTAALKKEAFDHAKEQADEELAVNKLVTFVNMVGSLTKLGFTSAQISTLAEPLDLGVDASRFVDAVRYKDQLTQSSFDNISKSGSISSFLDDETDEAVILKPMTINPANVVDESNTFSDSSLFG